MHKIAILFVSLTLLSACVYVPPVWDASDAINDVEWIEPGVTTKEEVVKRLGDPDSSDGERVSYRGASSSGAIAVYGYGGGAGLIDEKQWAVQIDFDSSGSVTKVTRFKGPSAIEASNQVRANAAIKERQSKRAEFDAASRVDPNLCYASVSEAMRLSARDQLLRAEFCREFGIELRWRWECLAAHNGDPNAQMAVSGYYSLGITPINSDIVLGYMWQRLAASGGKKRASKDLKNVSRNMTSAQVAEAERLAAEWAPDPTECDRVVGQ